MSSPDTFDRKFRRTARAMRRRPAPNGWDRIESRLDRRTRGTRLFGLRPWLIAAIVLIFAGAVALTSLPTTPASVNPLAQRAESVEELDAESILPSRFRVPDYSPMVDGRDDGYLVSPSERQTHLTVAPKYRL